MCENKGCDVKKTHCRRITILPDAEDLLLLVELEDVALPGDLPVLWPDIKRIRINMAFLPKKNYQNRFYF